MSLSSLSIVWFGVCAEIEGNVTCGSWTHIMWILLDFRFQFIVPKRWQKNRPVCIHLAGTGDHVRLKNIPMWCVDLQCNSLHPFPHAADGYSLSRSLCCAHNMFCVCSFSGAGEPWWPDPWSKRRGWLPCFWRIPTISFCVFPLSVLTAEAHLYPKVNRVNTVLALAFSTCHLVMLHMFLVMSAVFFPWLTFLHGYRKPKDQL